jgi:hypothetical protein
LGQTLIVLNLAGHPTAGRLLHCDPVYVRFGSGADIARHQANVALPPKADELQTFRDVRFVPKAS